MHLSNQQYAEALPPFAGNERVYRYHVTLLSNFLYAYDKYSRSYDKSKIAQSSYPGIFFLLDKAQISIGIDKYRQLLEKLKLNNDRLIVLETRVNQASLNRNDRTATGLGSYIHSNQILVNSVYYVDREQLTRMRIEDVIADAYHVAKPRLHAFSELRPATISILPVANGCQAKCSFCFSSASISDSIKQQSLHLDQIEYTLKLAKQSGARRAVITGGGEPGLLPLSRLLAIITLCRQYFSKVVLISNGYFISDADNPEAILQSLGEAGLTVLSISHHHHHPLMQARIMGLSVNLEKIASNFQRIKSIFPQLELRLICVLQKSGISSDSDIDAYIDWSAKLAIKQICFKELYVSSSRESYYYDHEANHWSYANQIPLSVLTAFATKQNWQVNDKLPWGSPVYRVHRQDCDMSIAAYTEPSLSWELQNGVCRSWNLMADGHCYSSLESKDSEIFTTV